jgi:hypothetical protein
MRIRQISRANESLWAGLQDDWSGNPERNLETRVSYCFAAQSIVLQDDGLGASRTVDAA